MPLVLDGTNGVTGVSSTQSLTAVASTSGTSIDFTGIPSWAKSVQILFNGVSTSGTSLIQIQSGSGAIENTGYASSGGYITTASASGGSSVTTGFITGNNITAANTISGIYTMSLVGSNTWVFSGSSARNDGSSNFGNGTKTFSGAIDRVRITTVNGTDTFDAGSINVLYE